MTFTDKTALVTGSTSGIGLAIATELARAGCNLALHGLESAADSREICDRIRDQFKVSICYFDTDVAKGGACRQMIERVRTDCGSLDILVNNAGIQHVAPVDQFPEERWDAILAVNLSAAFHCTAAALPGMRGSGYGRIINIASAHGLVASPNKSAYVAAKHGLIGLTKVTALETAGEGITCNAVCPGWVLTPLVEKQIQARTVRDGVSYEEATKALLFEKQPSGAFTKPADIGSLVVFLCTEAAANMTGASLPIDGGWTAR
ncbi:MAG TPA: 3-hydroxybutyrate dehydrogenase [Edaphobacter sp.]|nr:3-hydroxybutyrate dehydrogenase [Edaphobacter sp.]